MFVQMKEWFGDNFVITDLAKPDMLESLMTRTLSQSISSSQEQFKTQMNKAGLLNKEGLGDPKNMLKLFREV